MNKASFLSVGGLLGLTLLSGFILSSFRVSAEEVHVSNVSVAVPVSCELSGTNTSHSADVNNGTYREDIGKTTLTVFCNDASGFSIYAAGYTNEEVGGTDSTKLIGVDSNLKISTGTYTQGTTVDSVWAMKLTKVTDTSVSYLPNNLTIENGFSNYSAVPSSYTKVASYTSTTDLTLGSKLETTYAAYISAGQRADTYEGKVIYTIVHPADAINLLACNPSATTISAAICLQDFAGPNRDAIVNSMTLEQQYTLKDKRDNKTYTVAKLADGNVWMTQNLDLDLDSSKTYTNLDTDIGYNTSTGQYETASWTPERSTYTTEEIGTWGLYDSETYSDYFGYGGFIHPESYDPGNLYVTYQSSDRSAWNSYQNSCEYIYNYTNCNESINPISNYASSIGITQSHLGNYYNHTAAIAMNDSSIYDDASVSENANQSICPAGWTLPGSPDVALEDSYYTLWNEYGLASHSVNNDYNLWSAPLYFPPSGIYEAIVEDVGTNGYYWTSTVSQYNSGTVNYRVDYDANTSGYSSQTFGMSVRCIAR